MRKRMCAVFVAAAAAASLCGCGNNGGGDAEPVRMTKEKRTESPQITEETHQNEDTKKMAELVSVYSAGDNVAPSVNISEDITLAGNSYKIEFSFESSDQAEYTLKVNDSEISHSAYYYCVKDIYVADLDPSDGAIEILPVLTGDSDFANIVAYKYDGAAVEPLELEGGDDLPAEMKNVFMIGNVYCVYNGISLGESGELNLNRRTRSVGLWGVKTALALDEAGRLVEHGSDVSDVWLDGVFDLLYTGGTAEEDEMAERGYAQAKMDYDFLKQGDYFTILYDDGNDNVYIETDDGREGWINVSLDNLDINTRMELSPVIFMLAG